LNTPNAQEGQDLVSLRHYSSILENRVSILSALACTSDQLRVTLRDNPLVNIGSLLRQRDGECRQLAHYADCAAPSALDTDRRDELGDASRQARSLELEARTLSERIMACQTECETLMKTRLDSISKAIRQSNQRRKLDAAYGPAFNTYTPVYLDRQR
jgi:hypothetical protein